ncbi:MAG: hypothetical protein JST06_11645 [Bacteroidetes bacterium]|nr:hypothetical protein [Bacteroidota bacterium]MBS1629642.1 hypothetical protein [Bacteroidota bacterium]
MDEQGKWQRPGREDWQRQRDQWRQQRAEWHRDHRRSCNGNNRAGRTIFGIAILLIGIVFLLQSVFPNFPGPHFGWPLIVIIIGLLIGIKHRFRNHSWWFLILIGLAYSFPFTLPNGVSSLRILWPVVLLAGGLAIIFSKKSFPRPLPSEWERKAEPVVTEDADTLRVDAMFGGRKEVVTSRNFKGGIVRATFSGVELNLSAAEGGAAPMVLDLQVTFGGVELIVPSHWDIQNEIQATLGSIEDSRKVRTQDSGAVTRLLVLRGSCSFGSVEIKSY